MSGVMQQRSSPGPGSQALRDLKYRPPEASGESPWHHFLYGHVPGHQLDFICAPAVSVGEMHAGHRNRMAEFIKFIDPSQGAPFGFLVGNLSLNDTRHMPGRGGLALMFAVRVRDARDHVGRKGSAFAHGIAAVNRRFEAAKITEAAAEMHRRISGDAVRCENAIEFYRQYSLAGEQEPARAVGLVEEYLGGFTRLPLLEQGEPTHYWKVREGVKRERVVVTYGEGDAAETILRSIARISAILYCSDVKWEAVAWSCSERFNDGLSVRIVAEGSAGPEGKPDIVAKLSELPAADAALAALLFGAVSVPYATLMPSSRRGRTTMAPGGPPRPTPAVVPAVLPRPTAPTTTPGALPGVRQREASIPPTPISTLAPAPPAPSPMPAVSEPPAPPEPPPPAPEEAAADIDTERTLSRPLELPPSEPAPANQLLPCAPPPESNAESSLDILISTLASHDDTADDEDAAEPPPPAPPPTKLTPFAPAPPSSRSVKSDGMVMSMPRVVAPVAAAATPHVGSGAHRPVPVSSPASAVAPTQLLTQSNPLTVAPTQLLPQSDAETGRKPASGPQPPVAALAIAPTKLLSPLGAEQPRSKPSSGPKPVLTASSEAPTTLMPQLLIVESASGDEPQKDNPSDAGEPIQVDSSEPQRRSSEDETRQTVLPEAVAARDRLDDDIPEEAQLKRGARFRAWGAITAALLFVGGGLYWVFDRDSNEAPRAPEPEQPIPAPPKRTPDFAEAAPVSTKPLARQRPVKAKSPNNSAASKSRPTHSPPISPPIPKEPAAPSTSLSKSAIGSDSNGLLPMKESEEKSSAPPTVKRLSPSDVLDDVPPQHLKEPPP